MKIQIAFRLSYANDIIDNWIRRLMQNDRLFMTIGGILIGRYLVPEAGIEPARAAKPEGF